MDLIVLNANRRPDVTIDHYESLIWTERFCAVGDFEMKIAWTEETEILLGIGKWLQIPASTRVMVIEKLERTQQGDGYILSVKGKSLENILFKRVLMKIVGGVADTTAYNGVPSEIVNQAFTHICINGALSSSDILPNTTYGSLGPTGTMPSDVKSVYFDIEPLGEAIENYCRSRNIGYRMELRHIDQAIWMSAYNGIVRNGSVPGVPEVVYSVENDTLSDVKVVRSIEDYATNLALKTEDGYVYDTAATSPTGYNRRVVLESTEAVANGSGATPIATAREIALAKHKQFVGLDGEAGAGGYIYGTDVRLGDFVNVYDPILGMLSRRVDEYIFVSDQNGSRNYPTLVEP